MDNESQNIAELNQRARAYTEGIGVPRDLKAAGALYQQASDLGDPGATYVLAMMYEVGLGLPYDEAKATQLMFKAATGGHARAMHRLGDYYKSGIGGLKQDRDEAAVWYERAAVLNEDEAIWELAQRAEVLGQNDPAMAKEAPLLLKRASDAGNYPAMVRYAHTMLEGMYGLPKDTAVAGELLRKAARTGHDYARSLLRQYKLEVLKPAGGVLSPHAQQALPDDLRIAITTHFCCGDWGRVGFKQWDQNDAAVKNGGYICARYVIDEQITVLMQYQQIPGSKVERYHQFLDGEPEPDRWMEFFCG